MGLKAGILAVESVPEIESHHADHRHLDPDTGAGAAVQIMQIEFTVRIKDIPRVIEENEGHGRPYAQSHGRLLVGLEDKDHL